MSVQLLLWLGLGSHCKQAGDEGDLPANVSFAHCNGYLVHLFVKQAF